MKPEMNNHPKLERYSYDFKNLKFSGSSTNPTVTLIINWVFIIVLVPIICWMLKGIALPLLAGAWGKKLLGALGKLVTFWKGGRSP